MKRAGMSAVAVAVMMLGATPVLAARTQVHDAAESAEYGRKFGGMIGRGLLNGLTCFVDVLVNLVNETKAGPPLVGTLTGVAKGTGCGLLRLGSGVVDVTTFWVPGFNGFPVSDSYDNCLAAVGGRAAQSSATKPSSLTQHWDAPTDEPGAAASPIQIVPTSRSTSTTKQTWKK